MQQHLEHFMKFMLNLNTPSLVLLVAALGCLFFSWWPTLWLLVYTLLGLAVWLPVSAHFGASVPWWSHYWWFATVLPIWGLHWLGKTVSANRQAKRYWLNIPVAGSVPSGPIFNPPGQTYTELDVSPQPLRIEGDDKAGFRVPARGMVPGIKMSDPAGLTPAQIQQWTNGEEGTVIDLLLKLNFQLRITDVSKFMKASGLTVETYTIDKAREKATSAINGALVGYIRAWAAVRSYQSVREHKLGNELRSGRLLLPADPLTGIQAESEAVEIQREWGFAVEKLQITFAEFANKELAAKLAGAEEESAEKSAEMSDARTNMALYDQFADKLRADRDAGKNDLTDAEIDARAQEQANLSQKHQQPIIAYRGLSGGAIVDTRGNNNPPGT